MKTYRRKTTEVEAIQLREDNIVDVLAWFRKQSPVEILDEKIDEQIQSILQQKYIYVFNPTGEVVKVDMGNYIFKDEFNLYNACSEKYFLNTFEEVPDKNVSIPDALEVISGCMNIYALGGHKVSFLYPDNGYEEDKRRVEEHLKLNEEYTVDCTIVYNDFTDVMLKEIPGITFNSCHFVDVVKQSEEDDKKHPKWAYYNK